MYKISVQNAIKPLKEALTSVAQLLGRRPRKQKVPGMLPGQGTCLGHGLVPWVGCLHQPIFLSLSFSLPSPLSKNI